PAAGDALLKAIRDGKVGFQALFANVLTGLLDHETYARLAWPAGLLAREHGLGFASAQLTAVPGQPLTFPLVLAASGVRYLATGPNPERALPLLPPDEAARHHLTGEWTTYPQLYWWEGPDGSRVLHWRGLDYADALRYGRVVPVRGGETGLCWEDGAASTAAGLARFRSTQLAARAAELLGLWDGRTEPPDAAQRVRERAALRRAAWRDLLLFAEHTWGADVSVSDPDSRQTVAQWAYKRRFLESGAAAVAQELVDGLLRLGTSTA